MCASMSWRASCWLGLLGLLLSPTQQDVDACVGLLRQDYLAYQDAKSNSKSSLFVHSAVRMN
eukprot:1922168-Lingulodinium_polyedra.AAC.1